MSSRVSCSTRLMDSENAKVALWRVRFSIGPKITTFSVNSSGRKQKYMFSLSLYRPSERCSWLILAWTAPVPGHEDDMWRAVLSVGWSCWGCPVVLWRNRETAQQAWKLAVARHTINIHRPTCRFIQLGRLADRAPIDSAQWVLSDPKPHKTPHDKTALSCDLLSSELIEWTASWKHPSRICRCRCFRNCQHDVIAVWRWRS